jgi:glycosyltransferase involved in cell wall biosynthesis
MHLLVFSEPFPTYNNPGGGKFIESQVMALSEYMEITVIVPLRLIPPKEVFVNKSFFEVIKAFKSWYKGIHQTKSYNFKNVHVYYFGYVSMIRPYFTYLNVYITSFILYRRIKKLLAINPVDAVYLNWVTPGLILCEKIAKHYQIPLLVDSHANYSSTRLYSRRNKLFNRLFNHLSSANRIIVHSDFTEQSTMEEIERLHMKALKIEKIYLGQNFTITSRCKDEPEKLFKLVTVTHLVDPGKNIEGLIHAMDYLKKNYSTKQFHLDIIGDGILRPGLEELCKSLQLRDHVTFKGYKSFNELDDELCKYDIFVFPSYVDTFGLVTIEAIAKGLPVIACKGIGAGEELIRMGDCILLVEPDSSVALAKGIIELAENYNRANEMVRIGQKIVAEHFTWKQNALKTYNTVVASINEHKNIKH